MYNSKQKNFLPVFSLLESRAPWCPSASSRAPACVAAAAVWGRPNVRSRVGSRAKRSEVQKLRLWCRDLNESLTVQSGVGLLQPYALLLVLLQSERVDGVEGHVGLKEETQHFTSVKEDLTIPSELFHSNFWYLKIGRMGFTCVMLCLQDWYNLWRPLENSASVTQEQQNLLAL